MVSRGLDGLRTWATDLMTNVCRGWPDCVDGAKVTLWWRHNDLPTSVLASSANNWALSALASSVNSLSGSNTFKHWKIPYSFYICARINGGSEHTCRMIATADSLAGPMAMKDGWPEFLRIWKSIGRNLILEWSLICTQKCSTIRVFFSAFDL